MKGLAIICAYLGSKIRTNIVASVFMGTSLIFDESFDMHHDNAASRVRAYCSVSGMA